MAENVGDTPLIFSNPVAQFRLLLGDTDPTTLDPPQPGKARYKFYSDAEITGLLGLYGGNVKKAAVRALYAIAGSQALLLKSWSTDDLSVRGDLITESLRKLAAQIQKDIDDEEAALIDEEFQLSYFVSDDGIYHVEGAVYANPYATPL